MNAALFMLTSAWMAGADPAPAAAPAPAVISTGSACNGGNCGGCATACDDGCGKPGLFSRLKAKFGGKSCGCETAPACAPEPACKVEKCKSEPIVHCKEKCKAEPVCKPAPVETCGGCASACDKPGLFSRLKGRFGKHGSDCNTCDSGCGSATVVPGAAPTTTIPAPKEAPKKEMPKDLPKGGVTNLQIEPAVTPVVAPKPVIEVNGPNNPF